MSGSKFYVRQFIPEKLENMMQKRINRLCTSLVFLARLVHFKTKKNPISKAINYTNRNNYMTNVIFCTLKQINFQSVIDHLSSLINELIFLFERKLLCHTLNNNNAFDSFNQMHLIA
jgi:hypothetical protein